MPSLLLLQGGHSEWERDMGRQQQQSPALELTLVALLGGVATYALTQLSVSMWRGLYTLVRDDGLEGAWRDFISHLTRLLTLSSTDIFCGAAGMITALMSYKFSHTPHYKTIRIFWICIASLIYITPRILAILSLPKHLANEPPSVVSSLMELNIYHLFATLISFVFSLLLIDWWFRKGFRRWMSSDPSISTHQSGGKQ